MLILSYVPPSELFRSPDVADYYHRYSGEQMVEGSDCLRITDATMENLDPVLSIDGLHGDDLQSWLAVRHTLTHMPPETLFGHYGDRVLAWAAANTKSVEVSRNLRGGLERLTGYDLPLFDRATLWCSQVIKSTMGADLLDEYHLYSQFTEVGLQAVDLESHLRAAYKPDKQMSQKRVNRYCLEPLITDDDCSPLSGEAEGWLKRIIQDSEYTLWLDTPVGFAITYNGVPNALVGVAGSRSGEPVIHQLQGVRGERVLAYDETDPDKRIRSSARGLMPLDWRSLMVNIALEMATNTGATSLAIQSGDYNMWSQPQLGARVAALSIEQARRLYDEPAEAMGFRLGDDGNWHKPIQQI